MASTKQNDEVTMQNETLCESVRTRTVFGLVKYTRTNEVYLTLLSENQLNKLYIFRKMNEI